MPLCLYVSFYLCICVSKEPLYVPVYLCIYLSIEVSAAETPILSKILLLGSSRKLQVDLSRDPSGATMSLDRFSENLADNQR